jgi:hypothetical protein
LFNPSLLVTTQQPAFPIPTSAHSIDTLTSAIRATADNVIAPDGGLHDSTSVLTVNHKRLAVSPSEYRFFGKSSGAVLIQAAMELKQEYAQSGEPVPKASQKPGFQLQELSFEPHMRYVGMFFFVSCESQPYLYFSGSWKQISYKHHIITPSRMMTLP